MATLIRLRGLALAFALAAPALLAGCTNPFAPAKPETPTGKPVVPDFSTYTGVLTTLENAINSKSASGRNAFYDAIPDSTAGPLPSFYADPDPSVLDAWRITAQRDPPNPWWTWNERRFYDYLINRLPQFDYKFEFSRDDTHPLDDYDPTAGTALAPRRYVLAATSTDGKISVILAIGYADISLVKIQGRWYMVRWEDRVDPNIGVNPADTNNRSMGWRRLDSTTGL